MEGHLETWHTNSGVGKVASFQMEIVFPVEFIVPGQPTSLGSKHKKRSWQEAVRTRCQDAIPKPHLAFDSRVAVTLYYLPDQPMQGDLDNIIKPILDAMKSLVYIDDHQVDRLVVHRVAPDDVISIGHVTEKLLEALSADRPLLYVRVSTGPEQESL